MASNTLGGFEKQGHPQKCAVTNSQPNLSRKLLDLIEPALGAFGNNGDWLRVFEVPVPIISERFTLERGIENQPSPFLLNGLNQRPKNRPNGAGVEANQ